MASCSDEVFIPGNILKTSFIDPILRIERNWSLKSSSVNSLRFSFFCICRASRSLIEKVEDTFSEREALQMQKKLKRNEFTLEDFRDQLRSMRKMGSMKDVLGMLPGMNTSTLQDANVDDNKLVKIDAIISSMTIKERQNHKLINGSRRLRVAKGSGTTVSEINRLLKQFAQMRKMMQKLSKVTNPGKAMRMMQDMIPG